MIFDTRRSSRPRSKRGAPQPRRHHLAQSDPLAFAHQLGFIPDPHQAALIQNDSRRLILNCSRRWGKSTVTALKAVHYACSHPESLTIVVSRAARQSAEFVTKARHFLARLGVRPRGDGFNQISLLLPNGARIVGLPGRADTVRGFSAVGLLIILEAAFCRDEQYEAVRPMLATVADAAIWLLSTPHRKCGFFYEEWTNGGPDWERISVPATECPRISTRFLDNERRTLGEQAFASEYLCKFQDGIQSVFTREMTAPVANVAKS